MNTSKTSSHSTSRRPYDSPVRRQRTAETRRRILDAASELVHAFPSWDWRELTFRAVAEKAGVSERTVFRHFATERDLHRAVMGRLEEEAGISYEGVTLDDLAEVTARVFASFPSYAAWQGRPVEEPPFRDVANRRETALRTAVGDATEGWTEPERARLTALLDLLWSAGAYEHLTATMGLEGKEAAQTLSWAIERVLDAVRDDGRP